MSADSLQEQTSDALAFMHLARTSCCEAFVADLDVGFGCCEVGLSIPLTIADGRRTSYICCPSVAYADYAREELRILNVPRVARAGLAPLIAAGRALVRSAGLDRQVQLNNWLLATNPVPDPSPDVAECRRQCLSKHPGHALIWRSLDALTDGGLATRLETDGWLLLPNRLVYIFDCRKAQPRVGRNEARDRQMLASTSYDVVGTAEFDAAAFVRAADLYRMLYIGKYTELNPHYGPEFIAGMAHLGIMELRALRAPCGRLDGVIGFFDGGDDVMTAPVVGYDTSLPVATGLYRMLMSIAWSRARERRAAFNASAGADFFKRNRGAVPSVEYMAAYVRHLPLRRRMAAQVLRRLLTRLGLPLLKRCIG